jgi:hypothetical protein
MHEKRVVLSITVMREKGFPLANGLHRCCLWRTQTDILEWHSKCNLKINRVLKWRMFITQWMYHIVSEWTFFLRTMIGAKVVAQLNSILVLPVLSWVLYQSMFGEYQCVYSCLIGNTSKYPLSKIFGRVLVSVLGSTAYRCHWRCIIVSVWCLSWQF